jgi:hypothetical protein
MKDVTQVLSAIEQGDPQAAEQLLPLVYDELCKVAAEKLARERPGPALQATALVDEEYLRVADAKPPQRRNSCGHFFAAARAMRRTLVGQARSKLASKHGGRLRLDLPEGLAAPGPRADDFLALTRRWARWRGTAPTRPASAT